MPKRSKHSLSHSVKLTCKMGQLVPVACLEVLPGDVFNQSSMALVRTLPLLAPLMHKVEVRFHHWFVPTRLLWVDFEKFITGGPDGNDASVPPYKTIGAGGYSVGSLEDYLGLPTGIGDGLQVSALPFRAYQLIWNTWYRDQDLDTAAVISTASGSDITTSSALNNIRWEKDYFTSARPWAQKGTAVTVSLGTTAPVERPASAVGPVKVYNTGSQTLASNQTLQAQTTTGDLNALGTGTDVTLDPNGTLLTNLAAATGISVNALRRALSLQRFMEHRARFGSRYIDMLMFLGIRPQDSRIQLPEYLGGGVTPLQFSEVLQTADNVVAGDVIEGVGTLRGHGIGAAKANRYKRHFPEHGYVLTLMSVRPKTAYSQGIHRMWSRTTKNDYWQKELEHDGQMAILNKEIYAAHATPAGVFGYQDIYDEYRFAESRVAGEFRTTLNYWHMGREFSSDPALNSTFVKAVPTTRIYAVTDQSVANLQLQVLHSIQARRIIASKGSSFTF